MPSIFGWGRNRKSAPSSSIPEGVRVYAVGDIHGCAELLRILIDKILADIERHKDCTARVIFVGDYIDRGLHSKGVIDTVLELENSGVMVEFLMGNHEDMLIQFLQNPDIGAHWFSVGGLATVMSYGLPSAGMGVGRERNHKICETLQSAIPPAHRDFFDRLALSTIIGDYMFVHAGIRPGVALERQQREDIISIRNDFIQSSNRHPKMIVHGHSVQLNSGVYPNRICIDTGAYITHRLTCVVLQGTAVDFIAAERSRP